MRVKYNTIIIGAGASGLFCAKTLADNNTDVLVLEKMDRPGIKLLITGGGMCNITRDQAPFEMLQHYGSKSKFLGKSFSNLSPSATIEYFNKNGVDTFAREDHKVFPKSKKAISVLNSLVDNSYPIIFNCEVKNIKKNDDLFLINDLYSCRHLIISTGGITYPSTGSTGDGYKMASSFGHKIVDMKPSLTSLKVTSEDFKKIEGISLKNVSIFVPKKKGKNKYHTLSGDFLFTRNGISGPAVLDISRYCETGMIIRICLNEIIEPVSTNQKLSNIIKKQTNLPSRLIDYILKSEDITDTEASQTKKITWLKLNNKLNDWRIEISLKGAIKVGMSTEGGIETSKIDNKSFESKLCKNLYFTGEVMDYSGDCGGYSLQACWSTAYTVALSITQKNRV